MFSDARLVSSEGVNTSVIIVLLTLNALILRIKMPILSFLKGKGGKCLSLHPTYRPFLKVNN